MKIGVCSFSLYNKISICYISIRLKELPQPENQFRGDGFKIGAYGEHK